MENAGPVQDLASRPELTTAEMACRGGTMADLLTKVASDLSRSSFVLLRCVSRRIDALSDIVLRPNSNQQIGSIRKRPGTTAQPLRFWNAQAIAEPRAPVRWRPMRNWLTGCEIARNAMLPWIMAFPMRSSASCPRNPCGRAGSCIGTEEARDRRTKDWQSDANEQLTGL